MAFIPEHKVDEIKAATRIEDVIGTYIELKRSGKDLTGPPPMAQLTIEHKTTAKQWRESQELRLSLMSFCFCSYLAKHEDGVLVWDNYYEEFGFIPLWNWPNIDAQADELDVIKIFNHAKTEPLHDPGQDRPADLT